MQRCGESQPLAPGPQSLACLPLFSHPLTYPVPRRTRSAGLWTIQPTHSSSKPFPITSPRKSSCPLAIPTQIPEANWAGVSRVLDISSKVYNRTYIPCGRCELFSHLVLVLCQLHSPLVSIHCSIALSITNLLPVTFKIYCFEIMEKFNASTFPNSMTDWNKCYFPLKVQIKDKPSS